MKRCASSTLALRTGHRQRTNHLQRWLHKADMAACMRCACAAAALLCFALPRGGRRRRPSPGRTQASRLAQQPCLVAPQHSAATHVLGAMTPALHTSRCSGRRRASHAATNSPTLDRRARSSTMASALGLEQPGSGGARAMACRQTAGGRGNRRGRGSGRGSWAARRLDAGRVLDERTEQVPRYEVSQADLGAFVV